MRKYFIIGGAGFIGSHLVTKLIKENKNISVTVYDNFSSGKYWHLDDVKNSQNLRVIEEDIKNFKNLSESIKNHDVVYHFASNPDISKAITQPDIDFWEGTYLTNNVLEAMRVNGIKNLIYSSGSGVYGDYGSIDLDENHSPMLPISTYGASKLSCEAMICSYCFMFGINAASFRFANVVGPHQTHGIGYDFVKKLISNPHYLAILGNGTQSKSYIYVTDVLNAMVMVEQNFLSGYSYYNVATSDYITVNDIADIVVDLMNLKNVEYHYTGGDRGWKGDVPVVRLNSNKIRKIGWKCKHTSREAIIESVKSIIDDAGQKKFDWS